MAKRPMADDFIINVYPDEHTTYLNDNNKIIRIAVDLSIPEFEPQVLAAAGRFRSLKRQTRRGGRGIMPVICPECGEEVATREVGRHRRERHGKT